MAEKYHKRECGMTGRKGTKDPMKKLLCILLALSMIMSMGITACAAETHEITSAVFPFYDGGDKPSAELTLYFLDGANDLPWIEANDLLALLTRVYHNTVDFSMATDGPVVTYTRINQLYETDVPLTVDFDKDTLTFADYNLFVMRADQSMMLDMTSIITSEGAELLQKVGTGVLDRRGDTFEIDLGVYGIDLIEQDGLHLIPLQTIADILISPTWLDTLFFNGQCVIKADDMSHSPYKDLYYSAPTGDRSEALAEFGYAELCMMLDTLYGLKEDHKITSFDKLFKEVGFQEFLKGTSAVDADKAVYRLITEYLDDVHSNWYDFSYLTGEIDYSAVGVSRARIIDTKKRYESAREKAYPDGVPGYEEVGNTAYITFDEFSAQLSANPYYETENTMELGDTIGLIIYAHEQITREGSPIENVVIDLSCNGGGDANAAEFLIAWFLGVGSIGMEDAMTGAMCVSSYRADVNRDHVFDEKDTLGDRRLFCLISPVSFSSGNLVPCMFKESSVVTLLGRNSAGGACVIQPISSAWGTSFRISSPRRLSFMKNGSFYDIDRGAAPDFILTNADIYYNREALNDYINSLP